MSPTIQDFLEFLKTENDPDYGDFKREVDLHLVRLAESLAPLTKEQEWRFSKMREQLLWSYQDDIEVMRKKIGEGVRDLGN